MNDKSKPLNSYEESQFQQLTQSLDIELDNIHQYDDGWDAEPRPNPLSEFFPKNGHVRSEKYIPPGHIALQGDFENFGKQ